MDRWNLFVIFCLCVLHGKYAQLSNKQGKKNANEQVMDAIAIKQANKISDMILNFLEHFKNPDSVNMPLPIPDPMSMPDRVYSVLPTSVRTTNVKAYGVSKTRIDTFAADLVALQLTFSVRMRRLQVIGNYSWYITNYSGRFNVTIMDCYLDCLAKLDVTRSGELEVSDIKMQLQKHGGLILDFENNYVLNALGELIFEGFKPSLFKIINNNIRGTVNEYLKRLKMAFPNSIPPLDLVIAESRKFVRNLGFDPFLIPDYQYATNIYSLDVTRVMISGISSFYRLGNLKITMENRTIHISVHAGTELLEGTCNWEAGLIGVFSQSGTASFTVDYIQASTDVDQSLDVRKKPKVVNLKIKVGNIQLRMEGAGTFDYLMEFGVNVLPNILRYQIVQAAEMPMKRKLQEIFNNFDIEQLIVQELPLIDKHLSGNASNVIEDEFFDEGLVVGANELDQDLGL